LTAAGSTIDVSVVIPTYNRRGLLERTLQSVAALDPGPAEVVVVSDGSTDGSDEMVRSLGWPLLRTDRRGAAGARNEGWRSAAASMVAFLDDDCIAEPGWLGALVAPFADEGVGLVQGATVPDGSPGPYDRTVHVQPALRLYESCNIAYRRRALEQVGGFDEEFIRRIQPRVGLPGRGGGRPFGEDTHLGWRVQRLGWRAAIASDAVVRHHIFEGTFSDSLREEWRAGNFTLLLDEIPELRDLFPGGRYFVRRHSVLAQAAIVGLVAFASGHRRVGAALSAPYLAWLLRHHRGRAIADQAARDAVRSVSLLIGSARTGRVLL
jgi:glycosyltransferase involved in cell wall biosynthesis